MMIIVPTLVKENVQRTFGSAVAVAGGGVFALPSLYPDPAHTSEHRLMSLTTCGTCRLIMCHLWWDLQCMLQRCHQQVLTLTLLALITGKTSIWLHPPLQFSKAQVITCPLSHSSFSLCYISFETINIKWGLNGELCAVLEPRPAVKDVLFSLQLFQLTISNVYFTQNESKPYMIGVFTIRHQLIQVNRLPGGTEY